MLVFISKKLVYAALMLRQMQYNASNISLHLPKQAPSIKKCGVGTLLAYPCKLRAIPMLLKFGIFFAYMQTLGHNLFFLQQVWLVLASVWHENCKKSKNRANIGANLRQT